MKAFHSGREAKEFLISQIVEEAQRENIPLSEIERKMLYFTESGWTLPDIMKVNEDFDREYDQDDYEYKIAKLITKADKRIRKGVPDDYDKWWAAIRFLGIVTVILIAIFLSVKYNTHLPSRSDFGVFVWVFFACLTVFYIFLRLTIGAKKTDDITSTVLEKVSRIWQRVSGNA